VEWFLIHDGTVPLIPLNGRSITHITGKLKLILYS